MNIEQLRKSLIKHEGMELKPYTCTAGALSIGVGRNIQDIGITEDEALFLLDNDIERCLRELGSNVSGFATHDDVRQNVLIELCFNLGISRLLAFRKMLSALEAYDYHTASKEMKDSRWYTQVGQRAVTLCEAMRTGEFQG